MNLPEAPELAGECRRQLDQPALAATLAELYRQITGHAPGRGIASGIHPECQMLWHSLNHHRDAGWAISQYYAVALQQFFVVDQLIARLERQTPKPRVLDFACGFGRLLQFLVHRLPAERIVGAEIQAGAVAWVARQFGIEALQSDADPERFAPDRRFDLIWVASLFSHLPEPLFRRWLKRLGGLLAPGGVLAFTVHDQVLRPGDPGYADHGLVFLPQSENNGLDRSIYGTTFVTERFVADALEQALGHRNYLRRPRMLAYEQDLYLTAAEPDLGLAPWHDLRHGLRGWLDGCRVEPDGSRIVWGWAGSMDGDRKVEVAAVADGRPLEVSMGEAKPEVARVLDRPDLANSGWACRVPAAGGTRPRLEIRVRAAGDPDGLIFVGPAPDREGAPR